MKLLRWLKAKWNNVAKVPASVDWDEILAKTRACPLSGKRGLRLG